MSRKISSGLAPARSRLKVGAYSVRRAANVAPLRGSVRRAGRPSSGRAPHGGAKEPADLHPEVDHDPEDMTLLVTEEIVDSALGAPLAGLPEHIVEEVAVDAEGEEDATAATEPSANFLSTYFREMAQLAVLRPEEEYETARRIGMLEQDLWVKLLCFAPLCDHHLRVIERAINNSLPEFRGLRRAAADAMQMGCLTSEALVEGARPVAEKLRKLDMDRIYVSMVLQELKKIATSAPGRIIAEPVSVEIRSREFRRHLHDISVTLHKVQRSKNDFVKANLRLVVSIARRFNHGRMPLADLIQEGNIGLIKAVERFDYRRGYRFSTYASWWIRHAISRGLADKGRAVRLPVHMIDVYHRVARSKRELSGKLGRQPTNEELAESTGLAVSKIEKMRSYLLDQSFSLDRAVSERDGRRFIDFMQDESGSSHPSEQLISAAMSVEVRRLLGDLKPIEADILRQRFGLDNDKELTLKEIGEKYNLSRERIRQLQEQALLKMRRALVRREMA